MITIITDNKTEKNTIIKISTIIDSLRDEIDEQWAMSEEDTKVFNYLADLHNNPENVLVGDEIISKAKTNYNANYIKV